MENNRVIKFVDMWLIDFVDAMLLRLSRLFLMIGFVTGTIAVLSSQFQLSAVPGFNIVWSVVQAIAIDGLFFAVWSLVRDTHWVSGQKKLRLWYGFIGILLGIVAALVNNILSYQELSGIRQVSDAMVSLHFSQSDFSYMRSTLVVLVSVLVVTLPRKKLGQDDTGTTDASTDTDALEQTVNQVVEQAVSREVSQVVLREFESLRQELLKMVPVVSVVEEKAGSGKYLASDTTDTREYLDSGTDTQETADTVTVSITDTNTSTRSVVVSGGYRDQIRGLILGNPSITNKEIIGTLGCGESTVKRLAAEVRKELGDTSTGTTDTDPLVPVQYQEPDKLDLSIKAVSDNPDITDEQLAGVLELRRPASARFWRLKAEEILTDPQR